MKRMGWTRYEIFTVSVGGGFVLRALPITLMPGAVNFCWYKASFEFGPTTTGR